MSCHVHWFGDTDRSELLSQNKKDTHMGFAASNNLQSFFEFFECEKWRGIPLELSIQHRNFFKKIQKSKNRHKSWFKLVKKICYTHHWIRNLIPDPMMGITDFFDQFKSRFMSIFRFWFFLWFFVLKYFKVFFAIERNSTLRVIYPLVFNYYIHLRNSGGINFPLHYINCPRRPSRRNYEKKFKRAKRAWIFSSALRPLSH